MPRRKSFDEWHAEQAARYPNFDRDTERILARGGPPRKVPLLCAENLETDLAADRRIVHDFKSTTLKSGASDTRVCQPARHTTTTTSTTTSGAAALVRLMSAQPHQSP